MLFAMACKMREHRTFKPCSLLTYAWEYQAYLSCVCAATKARRSARGQQARNLWQCAIVRILWSQCGRACVYFLEHLSKLLDKKQFLFKKPFSLKQTFMNKQKHHTQKLKIHALARTYVKHTKVNLKPQRRASRNTMRIRVHSKCKKKHQP